ncbi:tRNA lysidine(34) synthetase TilS [Magnetococcales bacterium HHB-1]
MSKRVLDLPFRFCQKIKKAFSYLFASDESPNPLVVAVSGGSDSMALLHLLLHCRVIHSEQIVVAHFDHALRDNSKADLSFVKQAADDLNVRFISQVWQRPARYKNLQATAREARYHFLKKIAVQVGSSYLLTAHQQDDQAETVFDRLFRQSGSRGLAAIYPKRELFDSKIILVRPLLTFRRQELITWLETENISWLTDPSNQNLHFKRNRIRQQIFPFLSQSGLPDPGISLPPVAEQMQSIEETLSWMIDHLWPTLDLQSESSLEGISKGVREGDRIGFSLCYKALSDLPDTLVLRILLRLHFKMAIRKSHIPGQRAQKSFLTMIRQRRRRWQIRITGLQIIRHNQRLYFFSVQGSAI